MEVLIMAVEKITKLTIDSIKSGMIVKMHNKEYDCDVFARVLSIGSSCNVLVPDNANYTPTVLDANMLSYIEEVYDNVQDTMDFYISVSEHLATKENLVWKRMFLNDLKSYMKVQTSSGSIGLVVKDHYEYGDCIIFEEFSVVKFDDISHDLIVQSESDNDPIEMICINDNVTDIEKCIWER